MCYYPAVVCSRWLEIRLDWVAITTVLLTTLLSVLKREARLIPFRFRRLEITL